MFKYDSSKNVLKIYKVPVPAESTVYGTSEVYDSYLKYKNVGLQRDIEDYLLPALKHELNKGNRGIEDSLILTSCRVVLDSTSEYHNYAYNTAFVKLDSTMFRGATAEFPIFKLPCMDEFGVIQRSGKQYALISELVQDDDITYSPKNLKVITSEGCFFSLTGEAKSIKIVVGKKKHSAATVMHALAAADGIDGEKLFNSLLSRQLIKTYRDKMSLQVDMMLGSTTPEILDAVKLLRDKRYSLARVRDKINKVLSLDRVIGETLFESIRFKNGEEAAVGTVITRELVDKIKRDRINEVTIMTPPSTMTGCYVAENISIPILRCGTEMIPVIREYFPDVTGRYLDKTVKLVNNPIVIMENTEVSRGLIDVLASNGHTGIYVKQKLTGKKEYIPFGTTVVGNRCFTKRELGIEQSDEYVFVAEDGTVSQPSEFLTAYDLVAMMSLYDRLVIGEDFGVVASRDLGLRKKVNLAYESFHKAFTLAVDDFVRKKGKAFVKMCKTGENLEKPEVLESLFFELSDKWWSKLYLKLKLIQRVELDNPLAFYSSLSKINTIVKDKNAISMEQHSMTMGHYGRLCPYETPSGKTMGVVSNKAIGCKIENGQMKTKYYQVKHVGKDSYIMLNQVLWLTVREEEEYRIADITSLEFNPDTGKINTKGRVLARVPNKASLEKVAVAYVDVGKVDLVNVDPNQTDGLPATTIPFQGANDAARVIYGISMAKQAKPLLNPEVPIVMTSAFYNIPRKSPYFMIQAEYDGIVEEATAGTVVMLYETGNSNEMLKEYNYVVTEVSKASVIIRTNCVEAGKRVKAGDILVTSNFIKEGYMATGVNALVGYVPEGYNYEDGIFGSRRLAEKTISYGPNVEVEDLPKRVNNPRISATNKFKYKKSRSKLYHIEYAKGSEEVSKDIYSKKLKGFIVKTSTEVDRHMGQSCAIKTEAVSFDPLHLGDKMANRHGNKGVTPIIRENNDMPMFKNGEFLDLCYNPAGVPSRMNIGQVLECHLGLAGYVLGIRFESDSFNGASVEEIALVLEYAWDLANKPDANAVVNDPKYAELGEALHKRCLENIRSIRMWKGCFNKDGTANLINPRTGKYFETPVLVGVNYVYKLIHEAAKKAHGRGGFCTEPYVEKLSSPTKGASASGGQRLGYMELDALGAYGANAYMHELLNERGDNPIARNNLTVEAMHQGDRYKLYEDESIRRSTEYFVNIMEALGVVIDFEGELPNNVPSECGNRDVWKSSTLLKATDVGEKREDGNGRKRLSDYADELSSIK